MVNLKQGDIIFIDSEPHAGREEGGHDPQRGNIRRPLVVLSNDAYNAKTKMIVGMPITSKMINDRRIFLPIADQVSGVKGSVITYMIPNYDYVARHAEVVGKIKPSVLGELLRRAQSIF